MTVRTVPVPRLPGALPLLGHILPMLRNRAEFLVSLPKFLASLPDSGGLVEVRIGPRPVIVICDPGLTWQFLRDDRTFDKGGFIFEQGVQIGGNGLITCPHSAHLRQRRLIQPAFHKARFPAYRQVMAEQAAAVVGAWRDGQAIDVLAEMSAITSRVAVAAMFSPTLQPSLLSEMREDLAEITAGFYRLMLLPQWFSTIPTPGNRRYHRALARDRQAVRDIIAGHRASGIDRGDLLSVLLTASDGEEPAFSEPEILDQVRTFFIAGVETSAVTAAWALHLLAQHPEIKERFYAEVDTVLGGAPATLDELPTLQLTDAIVTETLRLCPPAWMLTRTTTEDARLGPHAIPAGATIVYSPYIIHHRPDIYPDPERFDPDRWTGQPASRPPRGAFIPFSAGARKCIGEAFAAQEITTVLATIATRWHLEPILGQQVRASFEATLRPRGLYLRVSARSHQPIGGA